MCSEFQTTYTPAALEKLLSAPVENKSGQDLWNKRVRLTATAPILSAEGKDLLLTEAVFPQRPFPNARLSGLEASSRDPAHGPGQSKEELRRIYERKTWRDGFTHRRCVVPISSFFEPAYWGPNEGAVMQFLPPDEGSLFFAAAIRIGAQNPKTDQAFSILTHTATPQMLDYHQRLIVLLRPHDALEWIAGGAADPEEKFEFLLRKRWAPHFRVTEDRRMASGWKSRIAKHVGDFKSEEIYREELKRLKVAA